jgi:hypothetical protein
VRIGCETPSQKAAASLVVGEHCIDLVCKAVSRCSWPVLDSFRSSPFWSCRVRDTSTYARSASALRANTACLLVIPKSIPTITSGFQYGSIVTAASRNTHHAQMCFERSQPEETKSVHEAGIFKLHLSKEKNEQTIFTKAHRPRPRGDPIIIPCRETQPVNLNPLFWKRGTSLPDLAGAKNEAEHFAATVLFSNFSLAPDKHARLIRN